MVQVEQLIRLRTWELDEKRRAMGLLLQEEAHLLAEADAMQHELDREKQAAAASLEARRTLSLHAALQKPVAGPERADRG